MLTTSYTLSATTPLPFADAVGRVRTELKTEGFGVLLPCNVVVYERGGETHISAIDPERMLSIVDNDKLRPMAADVKQRLSAVIERACNT